MSLEFLRQFRIGGYAIFDLAVSFLALYLLAPLLSKLFLKIKLNIPKLNWLFLTLPISIVIHLLVGNITPMTKNFFDLNAHYVLKILILGSLYLGIRGVKIIPKKKLNKSNDKK